MHEIIQEKDAQCVGTGETPDHVLVRPDRAGEKPQLVI